MKKIQMYIRRIFKKCSKDEYIDFMNATPSAKCFGEDNPKQYIYIARVFSEAEGHCSILNTMLGHIALAEKLDMQPVIDMKNYFSGLWQPIEKKGKENAWEYFYEQPRNISLEQAYSSKKVLLSSGRSAWYCPTYRQTFDDRKEIAFWHEVYKRNIHFNDALNSIVEKNYMELGISQKKTIAVMVRRGIEWGYKVKHEGFQYYPDVPDIYEIIHTTKKLFDDWKAEAILLVIDDIEGLEIFKENFPGKVHYINRERSKFFVKGKPTPIEEPVLEKNDDIFDRESKFLSEVYAASKCQFLYGSRSSTSLLSLIMKGCPYEKEYLYGENYRGSKRSGIVSKIYINE